LVFDYRRVQTIYPDDFVHDESMAITSRHMERKSEESRKRDVTEENENDPDFFKRQPREVDLTVDSDSHTEGIHSGTDGSARKRKRTDDVGERISWSEDDNQPDAAYNTFKNRKSEQRKKAAARTRKAKVDASGSSIVGRKPKTAIKLRDQSWQKKLKPNDSEDDDGDESSFPSFLKERRAEWGKASKGSRRGWFESSSSIRRRCLLG